MTHDPSPVFLFAFISLFSYNYFGAGVTQLVECKLPKLDAAGSSPVARSSIIMTDDQFSMTKEEGNARTEDREGKDSPFLRPIGIRTAIPF